MKLKSEQDFILICSIAMVTYNKTNKEKDMPEFNIKEYVAKNERALSDHALVLGNEKGKKIVYVFSDYTCPYCIAVHREYMQAIENDPEVRVVVKNFPIHGRISEIPAKAVIAAKIQGNEKAVQLDKLLMTSHDWISGARNAADPESYVMESIMNLAENVGLDVKKLRTDMNGDIVKNEMNQVQELAQKIEIHGTPFMIINGKPFPGALPYEQIKKAL
jgi:protein-disulfide isomerase